MARESSLVQVGEKIDSIVKLLRDFITDLIEINGKGPPRRVGN